MREILTVPSTEAREHLLDRIGETTEAPRWRSQTQRDHDRLLYSSAFQRLGGITQVTASEVGQPFHSRLTHSLKVAQVARRSAERLKRQLEQRALDGPAADLVTCLDEDATEAAALAHDIGHPPFGHLAETILNERAKDAGGFEGNAQSFRVVTRLALRDGRPGLHLTRQTLNGMLKYPWLRKPEDSRRSRKWGAYSSDEAAFVSVREYSVDEERSLEACLMDWADDVTYAVHDLDDFTRAGLIPLERLARDPSERDRFRQRLADEAAELVPEGRSARELAAALEEALAHVDLESDYEGRPSQRVALRSLGSMLITQYIEAVSVEPTDDGRAAFVIDDDAELQVEALKALTMLYVVRRPSLAVAQHGQATIINGLWESYFAATAPGGDRRLLPAAYRERLAHDDSVTGRTRLVADLVASMTEGAAVELYRRMCGVSSGSVLDALGRSA